MGGRGASSGYSESGKSYGSEFTELLKVSNIKFVRYEGGSAKSPQETMTKGRVYVTLSSQGNPQVITYYDPDGKRKKSIDLLHKHNGIAPHVHHGYIHYENGTTKLTDKERKMVDFVLKTWYNRNAGS